MMPELQESINAQREKAQKGPGLKLLIRGISGPKGTKPTKHCDRCQKSRYTVCGCKPRRER